MTLRPPLTLAWRTAAWIRMRSPCRPFRALQSTGCGSLRNRSCLYAGALAATQDAARAQTVIEEALDRNPKSAALAGRFRRIACSKRRPSGRAGGI